MTFLIILLLSYVRYDYCCIIIVIIIIIAISIIYYFCYFSFNHQLQPPIRVRAKPLDARSSTAREGEAKTPQTPWADFPYHGDGGAAAGGSSQGAENLL